MARGQGGGGDDDVGLVGTITMHVFGWLIYIVKLGLYWGQLTYNFIIPAASTVAAVL